MAQLSGSSNHTRDNDIHLNTEFIEFIIVAMVII